MYTLFTPIKHVKLNLVKQKKIQQQKTETVGCK